MLNPLLQIARTAAGAISPYRILKFSSSDTTVVQAAAATDSLIGVNGNLSIDSGERLDVIFAGIAEVEYGGNVTRGALLTADSDGKAVAAAPSAGVNNRIIGIALASGVSGDIGTVLISPCSMQGA